LPSIVELKMAASPVLTEYELERSARVALNRQKMAELGMQETEPLKDVTNKKNKKQISRKHAVAAAKIFFVVHYILQGGRLLQTQLRHLLPVDTTSPGRLHTFPNWLEVTFTLVSLGEKEESRHERQNDAMAGTCCGISNGGHIAVRARQRIR